MTFAGLGDTANIVTGDVGGTVYANRFSALAVTIAGFGTATVTDGSDIISIPFALPPNDEIPSIPIIIFGRIDPPFTDPFEFTGMGAVGSSLLAGYNLATAIGPINSFGGVGFIEDCSTLGHDPCLHTTAGLLSFTSNISETNAGTFRATLLPVPEPATLLLVASGVGVLVRRSGRRQA
ncbi:MAG TPA: PEP-CTERM sorting domain-containing protein [Vicinamibacterales bacterium]|nr:PEP-CTERM sorting domain-containing protein [Vicinamibacterales bacterium]